MINPYNPAVSVDVLNARLVLPGVSVTTRESGRGGTWRQQYLEVSCFPMSLAITALPIFKVSATGNDFLLIDLLSEEYRSQWQNEWASEQRPELVRRWCDRNQGLGADGMVILERDASADFKWDFYNSDGGTAEMCGNAARAVSLYIQRTQGRDVIRFRTLAGLVNARVTSSDKIEVELPAVSESQWGLKTTSGITYDFVRSGVPHAVVRTTDINDYEALRQIALAVKSESRFRASGVNVTFVTVKGLNSQTAPDRHHLESVTYERGVENFTLACGTGAIAAAFTVSRGEDTQEIEVQVPGGRLSVIWKNGRPVLSGPAKIVAEMHVIRPS